MKLPKLICLVITLSLCGNLCAWENKLTHPAITEKAATNTASTLDDYLKTQMGLTNGISTQLYWDFPQDIETRIDRGDANSNQTTRNISEWLQVGSIIEDTEESSDPHRVIAPWRPRHHFHDPTRNSGLDNHTDHPDWDAPGWSSWLPLGQSTRDWAISGTAAQEPFTNNEKWANARTTFYDSLISSESGVREAKLAETLLKLGCVLHLLEDMGVPAHTRNDFLFAHYRSIYTRSWGNPLEGWVEERIENSNGDIPSYFLTGWTPAPKVFDKVSDYFDTDTRSSSSYLGDGVSPPAAWGLSESTNYQFFSWSTISADTGSLYYFPHPNINRCDVIEEYGRTYLSGYAVDHLAQFTMSEDILEHGHLEQAWCTLGQTIYNNYADITIPRTIDYATGLVNYFFRGRLSIQLNYLTCEEIRLNITNQSQNSGINQSLKGGVFELYWDDPVGNRTQITGFTVFDSNNPEDNDEWSSSCILTYGASVRAEFLKPIGAVEKFTLVYKGNICENPNELDTDDSNAIAVGIITNPGCPFATDDCGCFLDPATPDWDSNSVYAAGNLVEYGGATYESNADNNINNTPSSSPAWWTKVSNTVSFGNPNWNAYPPFGGIGKTPKYMKVIFSGIGLGWGGLCGWPQDPPGPNREFILTQTGNCAYSCRTTPSPQDNLPCQDYNRNLEGGYSIEISGTSHIELRSYWQPRLWESGRYYENLGYYRGDCVRRDGSYEGYYYVCKQSHIASSSNKPGEGAESSLYWWAEDDCDDSWCGGVVFGSLSSYCNLGEFINNCCAELEGEELEDCRDNSADGWLVSDGQGTAIVTPVTASFVAPWNLGAIYFDGDLVTGTNGQTYICKLSHTSSMDSRPITGSNWWTYWFLTCGCGFGSCSEYDDKHVSGRVTEDGIGVAGVTMDGLGATTDSDGFYSGMVFSGWSGTVTPTKGSGNCPYVFSPTSRNYSDLTADQENQDYEVTEVGGEEGTPSPVWEVAPYETGSGTCYANMSAEEATGGCPPIEYYFERVGTPSVNSGWTTNRVWNNVPLPGCGQFPYFHFKVRDSVGNTSGWSTSLPCY
ncbi:MAG: hypothetical protein WC476_07860 [Phycisphaerae bacterium]|jgi:hypothetical protein